MQDELSAKANERRDALNNYFLSEFNKADDKFAVVFDPKFSNVSEDAYKVGHDYVNDRFENTLAASGINVFTNQMALQLYFVSDTVSDNYRQAFKEAVTHILPTPEGKNVYGDAPDKEMVGKRYVSMLEPSCSVNGSYNVYIDENDVVYLGLHRYYHFTIEKVADNIDDGLTYLAKRFNHKERDRDEDDEE